VDVALELAILTLHVDTSGHPGWRRALMVTKVTRMTIRSYKEILFSAQQNHFPFSQYFIVTKQSIEVDACLWRIALSFAGRMKTTYL
jgi:hypothetical protein